MGSQLISYESDYAVPPGETLSEALQEANLTQTELAQRAGLSTEHVNRLINGHIALTPAVAVKLEQVLGIPAHFWNAREADYRTQLLLLTAGAME